ncbi:hypothetical protein QBC32DRAFT_225970, partial [Pseudoneurospora amorphoporcata]
EINDIANRESCTMMACVHATGNRLPIYLIFKADPTEEFIHNDLEDSVRFAKSLTGFSSAALTLD